MTPHPEVHPHDFERQSLDTRKERRSFTPPRRARSSGSAFPIRAETPPARGSGARCLESRRPTRRPRRVPRRSTGQRAPLERPIVRPPSCSFGPSLRCGLSKYRGYSFVATPRAGRKTRRLRSQNASRQDSVSPRKPEKHTVEWKAPEGVPLSSCRRLVMPGSVRATLKGRVRSTPQRRGLRRPGTCDRFFLRRRCGGPNGTRGLGDARSWAARR
jgi:hypothetical protein